MTVCIGIGVERLSWTSSIIFVYKSVFTIIFGLKIDKIDK